MPWTCEHRCRRSGLRAARILAATLASAALAPVALRGAQAADIPLDGEYGTVAMCIIDAITDVPSADINFNVGGAPLARVITGEADTPKEACVFQRLVKQSAHGAVQSWTVAADCSGASGNVSRTLRIDRDKPAGTVTVTAADGSVVAVVDRCGLPYAERVRRELSRLPTTSEPAPK